METVTAQQTKPARDSIKQDVNNSFLQIEEMTKTPAERLHSVEEFVERLERSISERL